MELYGYRARPSRRQKLILVLFSKQSCGVALGTFIGIATLTVSQSAFLFCLLFALWTGAVAYRCAVDPPSPFCRFAGFTATTVAMAGLFQNNPEVNIALIRGAQILLGIFLAAIVNLRPDWKEYSHRKVATSLKLPSPQSRRLARQHAGRMVLVMLATLGTWLWFDIPMGPFGVVAASLMATSAIDSTAIRFSQRLLGIILGMCLGIAFTVVFLPQMSESRNLSSWSSAYSGFAASSITGHKRVLLSVCSRASPSP